MGRNDLASILNQAAPQDATFTGRQTGAGFGPNNPEPFSFGRRENLGGLANILESGAIQEVTISSGICPCMNYSCTG